MGTTDAPRRTIVAMGGGGFSMEPENSLLDEHVLDLARAERGRLRPRVCFVPTASGDSDSYIANFYAAFACRAEASHLALFNRTIDDIEAFLLDQDVVYVGGGNTANMLAVWRVHGVDRHRAGRGRRLAPGRVRAPGGSRAGRRRDRDGAHDPLPGLDVHEDGVDDGCCGRAPSQNGAHGLIRRGSTDGDASESRFHAQSHTG